MPELPEVERGRKLAESVAEGRRFVTVECMPDEIVYEGVNPARFESALEGRTVVAVRRRGKHLWFELDARPWPTFHFGMTGSFRIPDAEPLPLATGPKPDGQWPPRFTKIRMRFEDGGDLVMTNARRLGRIRLREDPENDSPIASLGFDPLIDLPGLKALADAMSRRSVSIKGLLLNQSFAAGVGNWIADEVLYQAGLDPRRPARSLDKKEVARLREKLRRIINTAVKVNAEKSRFPRTWLFHRRWGKNSEARTARGEKIEHITVAGRTTAWVPTVQK